MKWPPHEQRCRLCDTERNLTRHHLVPRQWFKRKRPGGDQTGHRYNIVMLCAACHHKIEGHLSMLVLAREVIALRKAEARRRLRERLTEQETRFIADVAGKQWLDHHYPRVVHRHDAL